MDVGLRLTLGQSVHKMNQELTKVIMDTKGTRETVSRIEHNTNKLNEELTKVDEKLDNLQKTIDEGFTRLNDKLQMLVLKLDAPRHEGAGTIITNGARVFVLRRNGAAEFPAGKTEGNEDIADTAAREFKEETGMEIPRSVYEAVKPLEVTGGLNGSSFIYVLKDYPLDTSTLKLESKFDGWCWVYITKQNGTWYAGEEPFGNEMKVRKYNTFFFEQHVI